MSQAQFTISSKSILNNVNAIRRILNPRTKLISVVKADAYGHGAVEVANLLQSVADGFAVAKSDEGARLRHAGVLKPILVFGTVEEDTEYAIEHKLTLTVHNADDLILYSACAARLKTRLNAHLKLNTGMNRFGIADKQELTDLLLLWARCPNVVMQGAYTHYFAPQDQKLRNQSDARFVSLVKIIRSFGFKPCVHAASSALALDSRFAYDAVRVGIGQFGTGVEKLAKRLSFAQRLSAPIVAVQKLGGGDSVGYGASAHGAKRVGVVPIGYADGYPRLLANRAHALVCDGRARVLAVCMDALIIDLTASAAQVGDEVVLLGKQGAEQITPIELAERSGTIAYEIMCALKPRCVRRFV